VNIQNVDVNFDERRGNQVGVVLTFSITLNSDTEEQIALTFETGEY